MWLGKSAFRLSATLALGRIHLRYGRGLLQNSRGAFCCFDDATAVIVDVNPHALPTEAMWRSVVEIQQFDYALYQLVHFFMCVSLPTI